MRLRSRVFSWSRRAGATLARALLFWLAINPAIARADQVVVPAELQADLIGKVAAFDRNFSVRAAGRALVLIVTRAGSAESELIAGQIARALRQLPSIGGLPHSEVTLVFENAAALAAACREQHVAIVYLAPELNATLPAIAQALRGVDVLTVGSSPDDAQMGTVLSFDLRDSKPRMIVNLAQAKQQNVAFRAAVLTLMRVVQ